MSNSKLLIPVPGLLYDPIAPPDHSILVRLEREISHEIDILKYDRLLYDGSTKIEISIKQQADNIFNRLKISKYQHYCFVSHSMGSLILNNFIRRYTKFIKDNKISIVMLAPVPPSENLAALTKDVLDRLMPLNRPMSNKNQISYRSRESFDFIISDSVFSSIDNEGQFYSKWQCFRKLDTSVILASKDGVFLTEISRIPRHFRSSIDIVSDSHSLKAKDSLLLIADIINRHVSLNMYDTNQRLLEE